MKAVVSKLSFLDKKAVKSVILGAVVGILATIIITVICALVIVITGKLPNEAISYISLGVLALGSFIGGYISARIYKHSGLLVGLFTGIIIFIVVFIAGINSITLGVKIFVLIKFFSIIAASTLGAVIGVNKKEKFKYK